MVAHGFVDHLPARLCFAHQAFVEFAIEVVEFALEFPVVVEAAGIDCRFGNGAAGLAGVAAISKAAVFGHLLDVFEAAIEVVRRRPKLDFAESRHVDEEPAFRYEEHRSCGCGVAAAVVIFTHIAGGLAELA